MDLIDQCTVVPSLYAEPMRDRLMELDIERAMLKAQYIMGIAKGVVRRDMREKNHPHKRKKGR